MKETGKTAFPKAQDANTMKLDTKSQPSSNKASIS
jgi:hypothetical protein